MGISDHKLRCNISRKLDLGRSDERHTPDPIPTAGRRHGRCDPRRPGAPGRAPAIGAGHLRAAQREPVHRVPGLRPPGVAGAHRSPCAFRLLRARHTPPTARWPRAGGTVQRSHAGGHQRAGVRPAGLHPRRRRGAAGLGLSGTPPVPVRRTRAQRRARHAPLEGQPDHRCADRGR
ncbi:hypothetical protein D9M69_569610 [compost metagenome]